VTIGKRLRFEVLKRDGFRCRYCGASADDARLEVDHVIARANGGGNDATNLATACKACNSGKSDVSLGASRLPAGVVPESVAHAVMGRALVAAASAATACDPRSRVALAGALIYHGAYEEFRALVESLDAEGATLEAAEAVLLMADVEMDVDEPGCAMSTTAGAIGRARHAALDPARSPQEVARAYAVEAEAMRLWLRADRADAPRRPGRDERNGAERAQAQRLARANDIDAAFARARERSA
jgi:hypothetical protein